MVPFLFFGAIVLIVLFISACANFIFAMKNRKYLYSKKLTAPPWADKETKRLFRQFNRAWSIKIEKTVNVHIKKAKRTLTDSELRERWYELKKFLFLAGISKGLPMFSKKIDEIWHFFLEDKELYREFCLAFIGEQIEHHPHEKPKDLPNERAWFDMLYLSFFNINSRSHLWGQFVQRKTAHAKSIERIVNHPKEIIESFGRHTSNSESVHTLDAFLKFSSAQMIKGSGKRMKRTDGYWYGAALFSLHGHHQIHEKKIKRQDGAYADGGGVGVADSPDRKEEWNEIVTDVNTFEAGTDSGATPSAPSDGGGSDSGSSCSSCSGCSS